MSPVAAFVAAGVCLCLIITGIGIAIIACRSLDWRSLDEGEGR